MSSPQTPHSLSSSPPPPPSSTTSFSHHQTQQQQQSLHDALDDVHTRFILNLPSDELTSSDRIFFQLEQAYWFYDDFYCESNETLPRYRYLRPFAEAMFDFSPLLSPRKHEFDALWNEFTRYKRAISTYGTILLSADATQVVLCLDWHGKSWTFPAGKVNQNENGMSAGARETYEETGFDPLCLQGRTRLLKKQSQNTWGPLREEDALVYTDRDTGKVRTCFVCRGVPLDFPFEPVCRKEVSEVGWHDLDNLPKKSFALLPFVGQLRRWIKKNNRERSGDSNTDREREERKAQGSRERRRGGDRTSKTNQRRHSGHHTSSTPTTTPTPSKKNRSKQSSSRTRSARSTPTTIVRPGDALTESGLAKAGDNDRWTESEMFLANERLSGRKIDYDGNPHNFPSSGDPHRFHVVGGTFMNSSEGLEGSGLVAPPPLKEKLVKEPYREGEKDWEPFFKEGGETPWGEVVKEVATETMMKDTTVLRSNEEGQAILNLIQGAVGGLPSDGMAMDDARKKKANKSSSSSSKKANKKTTQRNDAINALTEQQQQSNDDTPRDGQQQQPKVDYWQLLRDWVDDMERPPPSKTFGAFKFDVDAVMSAMALPQTS